MAKTRQGRRDVAALEARRFEAARLFARGTGQAAVMRALGVSRQTAHQWYHRWRRGGRQGLKAVGRLGRKPRLDQRQLGRVETALLQGPRRHGFATELWTLPRVATVIARLTGVRYHPGHVWYLLRGLQWSLQRPARRARERDEAAIRQWVSRRWPAVKKTPAASGPGSSSRTKAGSRSNLSSGARGPRVGTRPS
jgi:transposase